MFKCLSCNIEKQSHSNNINKFCCVSCRKQYEYEQYIIRWKNGAESGSRGTGVSRYVRKYLFNKYNNSCCKCGWNQINKSTMLCPLDVEHIDGNHKNNKEENLELLCPNCHSLTPTYKALNKGMGRHSRKMRYLENKSY